MRNPDKQFRRDSDLIPSVGRVWLITSVLAVTAFVAIVIYVIRQSPTMHAASLSTRKETSMGEAGQFLPTIVNSSAAPSAAPAGMVWIPGGEFSMGAMDPPATTKAGMHN